MISAGIVLALDALTKLLIVIFQPNFKLLPFFSVIYVKNTGAGFGILKDYNVLLIFVSLIVLYFIYKYYKKIPNAETFAFALISGGIVGNLMDRIFRGYVVDFLDFFIGTNHWPAFNIADSCLVIGVCLLLYYNWKTTSS